MALAATLAAVLLVIAGTVGVFLQYRTILGRTPGIALLVVFLALKLLELRAARDAVATALLCYFWSSASSCSPRPYPPPCWPA